MPPETMMSASPARIACAPSITAFNPEPHTLLMVVAGTVGATPPLIMAWRAGAWPSPPCATLPMKTSSGSSAFTPARSMAALMAKPPSSGALNDDSEPRNLPIGVRAPLTITASRSFIAQSLHPVSGPLQTIAGDHDLLDLGRALADLHELGVTVVALDRQLAHVAHAAVNLHGAVGAEGRGLRGIELGHRGFDGEGQAMILAPACVVHEMTGALEAHPHVGEHLLDEL